MKANNVVSHLRHRERRLAARCADASIVEGDHRPGRGKAVDDARIEIVQGGAPMIQHEHGDAGRGSELPVNELRARGMDVPGRCVSPRHGAGL